MIHAMKRIFVPIFVFLNKAIFTAADRFKRFEPRGELARTKPLGIKLGICIGFENKLARGIEFSCDKEFLLAWIRCYCGFIDTFRNYDEKPVAKVTNRLSRRPAKRQIP